MKPLQTTATCECCRMVSRAAAGDDLPRGWTRDSTTGFVYCRACTIDALLDHPGKSSR